MSSEAKTAPYGEWQSPITAELVSGSNNTFNEVHVDVREIPVPHPPSP